MELKHTKGTWFRSGGCIMANREMHSVPVLCTREIITLSEENEKLILSAPDLLEALIELYNAIDSCVDLTPEVLNKAKTAIQKATS